MDISKELLNEAAVLNEMTREAKERMKKGLEPTTVRVSKTEGRSVHAIGQTTDKDAVSGRADKANMQLRKSNTPSTETKVFYSKSYRPKSELSGDSTEKKDLSSLPKAQQEKIAKDQKLVDMYTKKGMAFPKDLYPEDIDAGYNTKPKTSSERATEQMKAEKKAKAASDYHTKKWTEQKLAQIDEMKKKEAEQEARIAEIRKMKADRAAAASIYDTSTKPKSTELRKRIPIGATK